MQFKNKLKIEKILGNFTPIKTKLYEIFDKEIIIFLSEFSKNILNHKECKKFPDLIHFGFWCRKSNLKNLQKKYSNSTNRIGRGSVLHIAPGNVPTNFVYSMVFGLLSGNSNIIRLPSKKFIQIEILCEILKSLFLKRQFKEISKRLLFIRYEKSDKISSELSAVVDARIIWGGDETINNFKKFYTKPRTVDVTFPNRYSVSIINSKELFNLPKYKISNLAKKFDNDTYTMDQFGCSSANSVFWIGNNFRETKLFWQALKKVVDQKYNLDLASANRKISKLMEFSINEKNKFKSELVNFKLIRLNYKKINLSKYKNIGFGTFIEINLKDIKYLEKYCSKELQTITYFGIPFKKIKKFILKNNIKGIDRIVPIGRAFDLNTEWDGIDVIYSLSRTIGS